MTKDSPDNLPEKTEREDLYLTMLNTVVELMEASRRKAARSINAIMTATYWEIGRQIVESEQKGENRAEYGKQLIERLAQDLTARFGRGFSRRNLAQMKRFYLLWPILQTPSAKSELSDLYQRFPLPWSHYVQLLEEALIRHIESFLLELGRDFAFLGRQRRLRIGDQWFRVDLLFFHRRLRCLVIIDLKLGEFTHADVGQMP